MITPVQQRQTEVDRNLLQILQECENQWKTRGQLMRLIGTSFTSSHHSSLSRLELEGLIEIRLSKNRRSGLRYEYRAVIDENGSKG